MSDTGAAAAIDAAGGAETPAAPAAVTVAGIFWVFLYIGATSFGGALPYLRTHLVSRQRWLDDPTFVQLLSISQSLPGLNTTNMAVLVGDRLRGTWGAAVALLGMCLPSMLIMTEVAVLYGRHGERPLVTALLHGVAAAAVGLILATTVQLGRKSLQGVGDMVFVALAVVAVHRFKVSIPLVLLGVGALGVWWYRPRRGAQGAADS